MKNQCEQTIPGGASFYHPDQCSRKAVIQENGKWLCRQHSEAGRKTQEEATMARMEKRRDEQRISNQIRDSRNLKANRFDRLTKALAEIRDGDEEVAARIAAKALEVLPESMVEYASKNA